MTSTRALCLTFFFLLWGSFGYFYHSEPGWNVNSRLALTFALAEHGSLRIDDYYKRPDIETGDVALFNGHAYSDKIPGTSLLGLPAFGLVRLAEALAGHPFSTPTRRFLITFLSVGVLAALAGVLLFRLLLLYASARPGPWDLAGALLISALTFLGTLLFFYSTLFMSYLPALFFCLWAVYRFERWRVDEASPATAPPLFSCGLLVGLALLCEYTVGIFAGLFGLYLLACIASKRRIVWYAVGALLGLLPFFLYTVWIFGRPAIPYQYEQDELFRTFMARGVMGASWPRPSVLWLITFHPFRGLFVHSPFLLVAIVGLGGMLRSRAEWRLGAFVLLVAVCYLLFNSGYYMWWGGWSFGPRHLAPAIAWLAIPLFFAWRRWPVTRLFTILLGLPALGLHLVVNAYDPQFRDIINNVTSLKQLLFPSLEYEYVWVFPRYIWPLFWQEGLGEPNVGRLLGLSGPASLWPLLGFWLVGACVLAWLVARVARVQAGTPAEDM